MEFVNLNMEKGDVREPVIFVDGYKRVENYTSNIKFQHIKLPEKASISLNYCRDFTFEDVVTESGGKPDFLVENSEDISYSNK